MNTILAGTAVDCPVDVKVAEQLDVTPAALVAVAAHVLQTLQSVLITDHECCYNVHGASQPQPMHLKPRP
jgi:hypothetical protein